MIGEGVVQSLEVGVRAPVLPHVPHRERRTYAALDLGTNNCRLLIARAEGGQLTVVDAFSRIVRLGEGLAASGQLSQAAMDRAVGALAVCGEKLRRRNVNLSRAVATEACRQARNGFAFIERVQRETGVRLEIIPPGEEARLAVLGCHHMLEPGHGPAVIFDIGGGSTELVLVAGERDADPVILDWSSAPWGVVSLWESEADQPDRAAAYRAMRDRARDAFARFSGRLPRNGGSHRLLGTSGTVTTLASVHLGLPSYDRRQVDGLVMPAEAMRDVCTRLSGMTVAERAALPCIGPERADLVVAGCAILEAILELWPAQRLGIADRGIREGILRSLMARSA